MLVVIVSSINVIGPVKANTIEPISDVILANIIISITVIRFINTVRPIMASVFKFVEAFKI